MRSGAVASRSPARRNPPAAVKSHSVLDRGTDVCPVVGEVGVVASTSMLGSRLRQRRVQVRRVSGGRPLPWGAAGAVPRSYRASVPSGRRPEFLSGGGVCGVWGTRTLEGLWGWAVRCRAQLAGEIRSEGAGQARWGDPLRGGAAGSGRRRRVDVGGGCVGR